jgi:hypothetical protein
LSGRIEAFLQKSAKWREGKCFPNLEIQLTQDDEEIEKLQKDFITSLIHEYRGKNGSPVSQKPEISSQRNHKTS